MEIFNENWRRSTHATDKSARLEMHCNHLQATVQNLSGELQSARQLLGTREGEVREMRAALKIAEGLRDHFERDLRVVSDEQKQAQLALAESERKSQEIESTKEDCIYMIQRLEEIITDSKHDKDKDREQIESLQQECQKLKADKGKSPAAISEMDVEARNSIDALYPSPLHPGRSQSVGLASPLAERRGSFHSPRPSRVKMSSVDQILNPAAMEGPLIVHADSDSNSDCESDSENVIDSVWPR